MGCFQNGKPTRLEQILKDHWSGTLKKRFREFKILENIF
jgi:hypothetical protein